MRPHALSSAPAGPRLVCRFDFVTDHVVGEAPIHALTERHFNADVAIRLPKNHSPARSFYAAAFRIAIRANIASGMSSSAAS